MSVAIVSTLRGAGPVLQSFVRYHLALGFGLLYLFFDDPLDSGVAWAKAAGDSRVVAQERGPELEDAWRRCAQFNHFSPHLEREVMARQCLNVEVAVQKAQADGMDWLLHIDADELFYAPEQDAPSHFAFLSSAGIERAVYPNLEALPGAEDIDDYFREVTLFKANRNLLPGGRLTPAQERLVREVTRWPSGGFNFYSNGKSAARVRPGLVPDGVHRFHRTRFPRAGQERIAAGPPPGERVIADARILHYACCGFDAFHEKYRILGAFADRWFGNVDIRSSIGDFHLRARDVVATGDAERARAFYRERAMLDDPVAIGALLEAGLLARIDGPTNLLERDDDELMGARIVPRSRSDVPAHS
jgi:hypothetical protein